MQILREEWRGSVQRWKQETFCKGNKLECEGLEYKDENEPPGVVCVDRDIGGRRISNQFI
jgi:hypothetical protein